MPPRKRPKPRYHRRIFGIGLVATGLLYGVGAPIYNGRIEDDLERRVPDELSEGGFGGVIASFSGQDGTLTCSTPLPDPEATLQAAYDVWGVRSLALDRTCRVNRAPSVEDTSGSADGKLDSSQSGSSPDASTSNVAPANGFATVGEAISTDPQFALLNTLVAEAGLTSALTNPSADPVTVFAPTDAAFDQLPPDVLAQLRADPQRLANVLNRHIVAGRRLSSDLVTGELMSNAGDPLAVVVDGSSLTVDGALVTHPDIATGNGVVHAIDRVLIPTDLGLATDEPVSSVAAAANVDAVTPLEPRPQATSTDAGTLEAGLNAFVTANPILFEPGAAVLTPSAVAIIDQVAAQALAFGGIAITVEGHTDTDGDPVANVTLSQARANTVREALIERGLDGDTLTAVGFGSDQRVIVDGVEDKEASRRVAFHVAATS